MARKTRQAPEPISARAKRSRVASPQAVSDAGESDAAERQEDDPLLDNPGVTSKKMSWRMLLASRDGMRAEEGVSAQSDNSNAVHQDCAEWWQLPLLWYCERGAHGDRDRNRARGAPCEVKK